MAGVSDNKAALKADTTVLDDGWEEQVTTDGEFIYIRPSTGEVTSDRPIAGRPVRTTIRPPAVAPSKRKAENNMRKRGCNWVTESLSRSTFSGIKSKCT
ncbi:hypothetical protein HOLleu_11189 [Holothuria leucospilota]|uniref:Uncharacterized protein n=1 Tax=Holothuria leucospilota TaxID=206669 RepID=A0A9Q1HFE6_HOLLE|nr:hypothetical protein HOLleu_11189 [Holothuria leucospilota]